MSIPKSVLIIGGSSQIGLAIAKKCSAAGALVSVISRQAMPDLLVAETVPFYWFQDIEQSEQSCQQQVDLALEHQPDTVFICNGVLHDEAAMPESQLQTPQQTAQRLLKVSENLKPKQTGQLLNWDATQILF